MALKHFNYLFRPTLVDKVNKTPSIIVKKSLLKKLSYYLQTIQS